MNCSAAFWPCAVALIFSAHSALASTRFLPAHQLQANASPRVGIAKGHHHRNVSPEHQEAPAKAQPATILPSVELPVVTLQHGTLTVSANNSDLSQILKDVAQSGGMTIDGAIQSVKVFGRYGPGNSRDVLTDLLTGLGYNFIMIGETGRGAPKELLLTPRTGSATPPAPPSNAPAKALNSDGSVVDENHLGPGAIVNVPPSPSDDAQERAQEHLERLRQMHEPKLPSMPTSPQ